MSLSSIFFLLVLTPYSHAQDKAVVLQEIVVRAEKTQQRLKDETEHVEVINLKKPLKQSAKTFTELIDNNRGIDSQTSCAFCGAKRVSINGLKGEHTTLLVDGLALHSTVSSFYGVDAIPTAGIDSIDVYRGAGAALSAPESIGGVINIITVDPVISESKTQTSIAVDHRLSSSINMSTVKKISREQGLFFGLMRSLRQSYDFDQNGITEVPRQISQGGLFIFSSDQDRFKFKWRTGISEMDSLGGNPKELKLSEPSLQAGSDDFQDRDVRKKYIGDPQKITDNVNVTRIENALTGEYRMSQDSWWNFGIGHAQQVQKSIYSHGYDYNNNDHLYTARLENQFLWNDDLVTFGIDYKRESMISSSKILFDKQKLKKDNFFAQQLGLYYRHLFVLSEKSELSVALRAENISTDWTDLDRSLQRQILAPRLQYRFDHSQFLTSRIGLGLGYRLPLTLFESQHGTYDYGFKVEIDQIEKAESYLYSLDYQGQDYFVNLSYHGTRLSHLAYGEDLASKSEPTIFKNSSEQYFVHLGEFGFGQRLNNSVQYEARFEFFSYPFGYKSKLPTAAVERRVELQVEKSFAHDLTLKSVVSYYPEQNLSDYGYSKNYNVAYKDMDVDSPTFDETLYADPKKQSSPSYFLLDLEMSKKLTANIDLQFSIKNIFDYTQTASGDTPLTWAQHGNHFHLDNNHIWGPLEGRLFILGIQGQW